MTTLAKQYQNRHQCSLSECMVWPHSSGLCLVLCYQQPQNEHCFMCSLLNEFPETAPTTENPWEQFLSGVSCQLCMTVVSGELRLLETAGEGNQGILRSMGTGPTFPFFLNLCHMAHFSTSDAHLGLTIVSGKWRKYWYGNERNGKFFCAIQLLGWQRFHELTRLFHFFSFQPPGLLLTSLHTWQLWPILLNQLTLILGWGWAFLLRSWLCSSGFEVQFHLTLVCSSSSWSPLTHFLTGSLSFALIAVLLTSFPSDAGCWFSLRFSELVFLLISYLLNSFYSLFLK